MRGEGATKNSSGWASGAIRRARAFLKLMAAIRRHHVDLNVGVRMAVFTTGVSNGN
jgi:hypothetical protein